MVAVAVIIHTDVPFRRRLAVQLSARGIDVVVVPSVAAAIAAVVENRPSWALIDPSLLSAESESVKQQLEATTKRPVAVVVLAYWADPTRMEIYRRHGAVLLSAAPEETDRLVLQLQALSAEPVSLREPLAAPPWMARSTPAEMMAAATKSRSVADAGGTAMISDSGSGPAILVVDDDPTFRTVTAEALVDAGFRVWAARDGASALSFVSQNRRLIDLAVVDVFMPGADGFQTKHAFDRWTEVLIPFVIVSAHPTPEVRKRAEDHGAGAFVAKPILDFGAFATLLHDVLVRAGRVRR